MNERHRGALVQRGEQVVLADFTEVGAGVVGQQHDPVGVQVVESASSTDWSMCGRGMVAKNPN